MKCMGINRQQRIIGLKMRRQRKLADFYKYDDIRDLWYARMKPMPRIIYLNLEELKDYEY